MSAFDRLDRIGSRAADRLNAEPIRLEPMLSRPNGRPLRDHGRETVEGRAIFTQRATPTGIQVGNRRTGSETNDFRSIVSGQEIEISLDRHTNPAFDVRQGDHIVARGRRFAVAGVRPDGMARKVLILTEISE